jgi:hypothetical protein
MLTDEIFGALRPHQPALVRELFSVLGKRRTAVDLSDPGAGKTYVSCAVAALRKRATLVVGPKISEGVWKRAAKHFGDSISFAGYEKLRAGNTPFGSWSKANRKSTVYYVCTNCQQKVDLAKPHPCYCHPHGFHCLETRKKAPSYGTFSFAPEIQDVIFDEVHRCGGMDSLNADLLIAAKNQKLTITGLSGTVACNPLNMRALGYALDLHNLDSDLTAVAPIGLRVIRPNFKRWARKHGCVHDPRFHGWKWLVGSERQREVMMEIRNQIIPDRGIRVGWRDIPGFPDRQITAELYNTDDVEKANALFREMEGAVGQLRDRAFADKDPDHPLTRILRARQEVELLKVPIFTELAQDYLDKGLTVIFFVNFRQTIDELFKRFPQFGILDGQTSNRTETLDALQSNRISGLIANSDAGGICCDMHDLDGSHPRVGLVSLGLSAVTTKQVFGRLHRDGALSPALYRCILLDGTIENETHRMLAPKLDNIDTLNDGDLQPENLRFVAKGSLT